MSLLSEEDKREVQARLVDLKGWVKLVMFTQELECQYCRETQALLEDVASLSDKISLEVHNFVLDKDKAEQYGVDKIPAVIVEGQRDYGIRFYGIPAGYEFAALLEDIKMVSSGESGLSQETKEAIDDLSHPVHIQVFVTPTCPYCPRAGLTAHQMAFESELVRADMVEATEFPHLANRYGVYAVPKVVINETTSFEGALPEPQFLQYVLQASSSGRG